MTTYSDLPCFPSISNSIMGILRWTEPTPTTPQLRANYRMLIKNQISLGFCKERRPIQSEKALFDQCILLLVSNLINKDYSYYYLDRLYKYITELDMACQKNIKATIECSARIDSLMNVEVQTPEILEAITREQLHHSFLMSLRSVISARNDSQYWVLFRSLQSVSLSRRSLLLTVKQIASEIMQKAKFGEGFTLQGACFSKISHILRSRLSIEDAFSDQERKTLERLAKSLPLPHFLCDKVLDNMLSHTAFEKENISRWCFESAECQYYKMLTDLSRL